MDQSRRQLIAALAAIAGTFVLAVPGRGVAAESAPGADVTRVMLLVPGMH